MCVVSNIGDNYRDAWKYPTSPPSYPQPVLPVLPDLVTREEFKKLQSELENLKKLLKLAKEVDRATGQPDCEMDEKLAFLREAARLLDVDLNDAL